MLNKFFITSTQETFQDDRSGKDGEVFIGRILRILVREYRISPLQIGRKYCNINQVVVFTEKQLWKRKHS